MAEKIMSRLLRRRALLFVAAGVGIAAQAGAQTWTQPAGGNWNNNANWDASPFPNAPGATANLNSDITGSATINLQQDITVGTLNLGDVDGSHSVQIASGSGTNTLIFEGANPGDATTLNISPAAFPNNFTFNTISAGIRLGGTSSLTINFTGTVTHTQPLMLAGEVDTNGNTLFLAGPGTGNISLMGKFIGDGTIVKNGTNTLNVNSFTSSFNGSVFINNGMLGLVTGSLTTPSNLTINGYQSSSAFVGGQVRIGSNSGVTVAPAQRLATSLVTFNGGYLHDSGQALSGAAAGQTVSSSTAAFHFNSGQSSIDMSVGTGAGGTTLNVGTITRNVGATMTFRAANAATTKLVVGNVASLLVGAGGSVGSTSLSIIPWMSGTTNVFNVGNNFITWDGTTLRPLASGEYANSITASPVANVSVFGFSALASDTSVNALQMTNFNTSNVGTGRTLTITSGALIFQNSGSGIGTPGGATAGTISFGSTEGIVWSLGANSNTIGSVLIGSGGLTKGGAGMLTLAGDNMYTGTTYVAGGTLRVGNGMVGSDLGAGNINVAAGAVLQISSASAIDDVAAVILDINGLYNGKIILDTGINEQIGALYFGDVLQAFGTWGSLSSAADNRTDLYFTGTGILNVVPVPEPSTALLVLTAGAMFGRRRSRMARNA
jgi:fibronectin-binding autotransporter adhesin